MKRHVCVELLPEDEAWILFKDLVGEKVDTNAEFKEIAKKVVIECGGLPLIIQVVGSALKNKSIDVWKAALDQLMNHVTRDSTPEVKRAFNHIKLSYNYLENEEARSCFLLCSMFPEDENIELESLVQYGIGLAKFDDLQSVEDARNRVQIAVNTLKSSFLLLDGDKKGTTKMHDLVRDMALLIASEGKKETVVMAGNGLTQWHPTNATENYIGISLMRNKICELPDHEFRFPHLDSFLIPNNRLEFIPDDFIRGIKEVKVFDVRNNNISSPPESFNLLTKLCTLNLSHNFDINEISILGEIKNLQILILDHTGVTEIPVEIGKLTKLRWLSAQLCDVSHIAPGVISNLICLEELAISWYGDASDIIERIEETANLPLFTNLQLVVNGFHCISKNFHFENLHKFKIIVGSYLSEEQIPAISKYDRFLILNFLDDIPSMKPYSKLIMATDEIHSFCSCGLDENIIPRMYTEGFDKFKRIHIEDSDASCLVADVSECDEMKTMISSNDLVESATKGKFFSKVEEVKLERMDAMEVLWNCPDDYISFHNLQHFEADDCGSLRRLFPVSVAKGLVNLQSLILHECNSLEALISIGGDEETSDEERGNEEAGDGEVTMESHDVDFVLPRLTFIKLDLLDELKSFYDGTSTIKYPSLKKISIRNCPNMKTWGYGIQDMPKMHFRHQRTSYNINDRMAKERENGRWTIFKKVNEKH